MPWYGYRVGTSSGHGYVEKVASVPSKRCLHRRCVGMVGASVVGDVGIGRFGIKGVLVGRRRRSGVLKISYNLS